MVSKLRPILQIATDRERITAVFHLAHAVEFASNLAPSTDTLLRMLLPPSYHVLTPLSPQGCAADYTEFDYLLYPTSCKL